MRLLRKCKKCGEYTLKEKCLKCGVETINPHPAKFNPQDKFGKYRRKAKGIE